jgi:hypothetical protein
LQILAVLLAFPLTWWLASLSAGWYYQEQQGNNFSAYPSVRIWLSEPKTDDAKLQGLYDEFPNGVYRLLLENRETLFLFKLPPDGKPAQLPIIQLPQEQVKLFRIFS